MSHSSFGGVNDYNPELFYNLVSMAEGYPESQSDITRVKLRKYRLLEPSVY